MSSEKIQLIQERLEKAFMPTHLEVIDESAEHAGHVGAQNGSSHFLVIIQAPILSQQSPIQAHRAVYQALGSLMKTEIHALRIQIMK